jgi:hypothetical protein
LKAKPDANHANTHPHQCLVVSNLQPAPRHVPRSRIWLKSDTTRTNRARTDITGLAFIMAAILAGMFSEFFGVFS